MDDRHVAVILEEMRSQFRAFGEALQGMDAKFEARFDAVDQRFERVDQRFERVDQRFERIDRDLAFVKGAVLDNSREIRVVRKGLDEVRGSVDELCVDMADVKATLTRIEGTFDARVEAVVDRKLDAWTNR